MGLNSESLSNATEVKLIAKLSQIFSRTYIGSDNTLESLESKVQDLDELIKEIEANIQMQSEILDIVRSELRRVKAKRLKRLLE